MLLLEAPLNVLLLSRQRRPGSPRRILYGEVVEITRRELAMTDAEARALFDQTTSEKTR